MTPNKYIKHWGIDRAKREVALTGTIAVITSDKDWLSELKRLVESHELVVQCGGLEDARNHLERIRFNITTKTWFGQALLNWSMYADKLEKTIADVESCQ